MHWSCKYLGLSYKEYDCAELVELVLRKEFGIDRSFPRPSRNAAERFKTIRESMSTFLNEEPTQDPREGDCIIMSGSHKFNHVGVLVIHKGIKYCLHSSARFGSVVRHQIRQLPMMQLNVEGYYTWQR